MTLKIELLQFEPNTVCNLRCPVCPATHLGGRPRLEVDAARYASVVGPAFQPPYLLILSGFSESLLHGGLEGIVEYEKARGCQVFLATNGTRLGRGRAERLLEAGVDQFVVSFDSANPAIFARIRKGASLGAVWKNLGALRRLIEKKGSACRITINAVVTKSTAQRVIELVEFLAGEGLRDLALIKIMKMAGMKGGFFEKEFLDWEGYRALDWDRLRSAAARVGVDLMYSDGEIIKNSGCHLPGKGFYLSADFQLSACPLLSFHRQHVFGNLAEESIEEITSSHRYREFCRVFEKGGYLPECLDCACLFSQAPARGEPAPSR